MAEARKSITALYQDFEAAHSALWEEPETEGNVAVCRKIAAAIVTLPAENIDEMILKIRVALRCAGALRNGETLPSIDCDFAAATGFPRVPIHPKVFQEQQKAREKKRWHF